MFIEKNVQDAINEQIKNELYSAYLYLAMSAHLEAESLSGFAKWTRMQAEEEVEHAMRLFDYLNQRGGRAILHAIDQPPIEYGTPIEIFETILAHEQKVTGLINQLYEVALEENDYATQVMLHWFIDEQVEEEDNASSMVEQLRMVGDSKAGLIQLDHMAGSR
ncbi:MAG: ferritin [Chloroflexota bacterium]|nr:ferritin [Chloroflexota bacterium]